MTTAQGLVQHAVRRDLQRARILLSTQLTIAKPRREALAHHLVWLLDMMSTQDAEMTAAMARLDRAARAFFASPDRVPRRDLLVAVSTLGELQAARHDWIPVGDPNHLSRQVHWLVDGLEARAGDHVTRLLTQRSHLPKVRLRAEVYRYRKDLLWGGTPAYALPRPSIAG
jgi:hypothetical protein